MSEIIAYRCWNLMMDSDLDYEMRLKHVQPGRRRLRLWSLGGHFAYNGPTAHSDLAPSDWNYNGLYSFKELGDAANYSYCAHVYGEVSLYGKIVEHEKGYRAHKLLMKR